MHVIKRLLRNLKATCLTVSWSFLMWLVLAHMLTSWLMMYLAGEEVATSLTLWSYFYVVSASTVGYGDYSPSTMTGQWVAILYLIPGGISLFAALIGKSSISINKFWRQRVEGMGDYRKLEDHTLVIGWHGETTEHILDILKTDPSLPDEVVLCVVKDMTNPRPGDLKFVRGESFSNAELLTRAGIAGAKRIIIYDKDDERVATIAMSAHRLKSANSHMVAHCDDANTAAMLRETLPGIETTSAMSLETLVRSATDPGISRVLHELLAIDHGATQYQAELHGVPAGATFADLFIPAKQALNVTILGLSNNSHAGDVLNTPMDQPIKNGDIAFYMGSSRLTPEQLVSLINDQQRTEGSLS